MSIQFHSERGGGRAEATSRAPLLPETRFTTHDGHIWPVSRARMTDADAIHARMTDDLVAAAAQKIPATGVFSYLQQQCWTSSQIVDHSRTAIDLAVSAKRGAAA